jgi:TIR domain
MAKPPRLRIFISYARKDGASLASHLQHGLNPDYDVWLDAARLEAGASWTLEIEKAIDRCDVLLALMTPGSYVSDICRAEQLRALRLGKRVIPLLAA